MAARAQAGRDGNVHSVRRTWRMRRKAIDRRSRACYEFSQKHFWEKTQHA
jgi:hypothetical protein